MDRRVPLILIALASVALVAVLIAANGFPLPRLSNPSIKNTTYTPPLPTPNWTHLATVTSPNSTSGMVTYLPNSGELLLVVPGAGCGPSSTWVFAGQEWVNVTAQVGPGPTPGRGGGGLAYDAADGYAVLFGGASACGVLNDTWEFANNSWSRLVTPVAPPPLARFAMTYDATDGYVLLTGGCCVAGFDSHETWAFVHGGWRNVTAPPFPEVDEDSAMTYDTAANEVVFVDGYASGYVAQSTWTYVGGVWNRTFPNVAPANRAGVGLAYDGAIGATVLVGGYTKVAQGVFVNETDTWLLTQKGAGFRWRNISANLTNAPPFVVAPSLLAYDAAEHEVVLYSGFNETWVLRTV
jgi:hypothetical protein